MGVAVGGGLGVSVGVGVGFNVPSTENAMLDGPTGLSGEHANEIVVVVAAAVCAHDTLLFASAENVGTSMKGIPNVSWK